MKGEARILVVDDDEDIRYIVTRTLEKMGYEILGVGSGLEAIRVVASQKFHLALDEVLRHLVPRCVEFSTGP